MLAAVAILFVFGIGSVVAVWGLFDPHWLWLLVAYMGGSLIGLGVLALSYITRETEIAPPPGKTASTVPPTSH